MEDTPGDADLARWLARLDEGNRCADDCDPAHLVREGYAIWDQGQLWLTDAGHRRLDALRPPRWEPSGDC